MKVCDDGAQPDVSFISAHQIRALELMDRPGFVGGGWNMTPNSGQRQKTAAQGAGGKLLR